MIRPILSTLPGRDDHVLLSQTYLQLLKAAIKVQHKREKLRSATTPSESSRDSIVRERAKSDTRGVCSSKMKLKFKFGDGMKSFATKSVFSV